MASEFRLDSRDEETFKFDKFAHAVTTITEEHRLTHDGMVYHASGREAVVANLASLDLLFAIPALVFPHMRKLVLNLGDGPCDVLFYEGVTTSDDGSALLTYNRNRNSSRAPGTVLTKAPTVTDLGTLIHDRYVGDPGGQGANQIGANSAALGEEWVGAPSTKYLLRVTNNSGGNIIINFEMMWYEIAYQQ